MSGARRRVAGNSPWEPLVGYCRAVRQGPHVFVAGTTATDAEGRIVGPGDAFAQARQALRNIEAALGEIGATLADVVRTRMYITDLADAEAVGRAHAEAFATVRPVATMVQVAGLIDPAMRVEIEVDALVEDAPS